MVGTWVTGARWAPRSRTVLRVQQTSGKPMTAVRGTLCLGVRAFMHTCKCRCACAPHSSLFAERMFLGERSPYPPRTQGREQLCSGI